MIGYIFCAVIAIVLIYLFAPTLYKKLKVKTDVVLTKVTDALDNPIEEAKYDIKVGETELVEAKKQLVNLVADVKILEHERATQKELLEKNNRVAKSYADKQDETNARKSLRKAKHAQGFIDNITTQIDGINVVVQSLRDNIETHESRIDGAKSKVGELSARFENAKLKDKYTSYEFSDTGLKSIDSFEKKVEAYEAKTEAKAEVFESGNDILVNDDVEDELNKLMGR